MVKLKFKTITTACSQCRRAGEKLFLKGDKCSSPKCPILKRNFPPGQHGPTARKGGKMSGYGKQLREKQKVKKMYGLMEKQFSNYVAEAARKPGDTSKYLLMYLESRLDNAVYRAGFTKSRAGARQMVRHGSVSINDKKIDIPSYRVKVGEVISLSSKAKNKKGFEGLSEKLSKIEAPSWLGVDAKEVKAKILNTPTVADTNFNAKSIIEFYTR